MKVEYFYFIKNNFCININLFIGGAKKHGNEMGETTTTNTRFDGNGTIRGDCEAINRVKAKLCGMFNIL